MSEKRNNMKTFRIDSSASQKFDEKCEEFGKRPSTVLREMLNAFIEGRVTIKRTVEQKNGESYYVD